MGSSKMIGVVLTTILVLVAVFAAVLAGLDAMRTNADLADAEARNVGLQAQATAALEASAQARAEADAAEAEKDAALAEERETQADLRRVRSELDAIQSSYDFVMCAGFRPENPPRSYSDQDIVQAWLTDYINTGRPGAVVTGADHWEYWRNYPHTFYTFIYAGLGQEFVADFMVYSEEGGGYVPGIFSLGDECFIAGPEDVPVSGSVGG